MVATVAELQARAEIVAAGRRMYDRGLVVAMDGNLSARVGADRILATPSGRCKGFLAASDLVLVDGQGRSVSTGRASTEIDMHLAIYAERPDVAAIVHGHPAHATAFATAGRALDLCLLPEVVVSLGRVPLSAYGTPSTAEVADAVRGLARQHDAFLLRNHGAVALGDDVWAAYYKLETVEHLAKIALLAEQLGGAQTLSESQVTELMRIRGVYGLEGNVPACRTEPAGPPSEVSSAGGTPSGQPQLDSKRLARIVAEEIARVLEP
jgi:L-fuculose-phosphate aldolase